MGLAARPSVRPSIPIAKGDRMPASSRPRAASTAARRLVLASLKDDHKHLRRAFRDFDKLDPRADADQMHALVTRALAQLEVHAALEAELVYPAARAAASAAEPVEEAEVAHAAMQALVDALKASGPSDPKYVARFRVLGEYLGLHAADEEETLFPRLERGAVDWETLSGHLAARRAELARAHRLELDPVAATMSGAAIAPPAPATAPASATAPGASPRRGTAARRGTARGRAARTRRSRPVAAPEGRRRARGVRRCRPGRW
jgi:hypothetical protein